MKKNLKKMRGEIYTPENIVKQILDGSWYLPSTSGILEKHIMDNSCGKGAFLVEIVKRYVLSFANFKRGTQDLLKEHLETYIHGIEINPDSCAECVEVLNKTLFDMGLDIRPSWDIKCENALENHDYDGLMDFVVGNPPYVRVHNLKPNDELYRILKNYEFCKTGSTDMYIAFYELGLRMLNETGTLCYISPNGWLKGPAGRAFREYVRESKTLVSVFDNGHLKIFDGVTAYTSIFKFKKNASISFVYYTSNENGSQKLIPYNDMFIGDEMYLGENIDVLRNVLQYDGEKSVRVKNGLATLLDDFFIYPKPKFNGSILEVPIVKASTGERKICFLPHAETGASIPLWAVRRLSEDAFNYIMDNKERLEKRDFDGDWYGIGRRQGLSDVMEGKITVNNIIRDASDLKINVANGGTAVYSGFYVLFLKPEDSLKNIEDRYSKIKNALMSNDFVDYVKALKKYKSGGYYTFTARQLEKFLNWKLAK